MNTAPTARQQQRGFSLLELMIAVAIIGILAMVAVPAYQESIKSGRRADARNVLMAAQVAQERYRGNHTAYASAMGDLASYGAPATSESGFYTVAVVSSSATAFVVSATPTGAQTGDTCGTFAVNQDGPFAGGGTYASADCWN